MPKQRAVTVFASRRLADASHDAERGATSNKKGENNMSNDKSETKWTKEPWSATFPLPDITNIRDANGYPFIGFTAGNDNTKMQANAARIVACVNKLAGHPDLDAVEIVPKGTLEALREVVRMVQVIAEHSDARHFAPIRLLNNKTDVVSSRILSRADAQKGGE